MTISAGSALTTHAFEPVTRDVLETLPRHGAYTYVLFAQPPDAADDPVRRRYEALLAAIVTTTPHIDEVRDPRERINLFCIPSTNREMRDRRKFALGDYDWSLALALLATAGNGSIIEPGVMGRVRSSPGPFLLTTFEPLDRIGTASPLLFADLSGYAVESYRDIVGRYKERLVSAPPVVQTAWEPSRTQWLFGRGSDLYAEAHRVAGRVADVFEDWFSKGDRKVALFASADPR